MLFREQVLQHQDRKLWGKVVLIQPFSQIFYSVVAVLVVTIIGCFLFWGQYAKKERVQGYLVPTKGLVKLYARRPGTVSSLAVEGGETVDEDAELAVISAKQTMVGGGDIDAAVLEQLGRQKDQLLARVENEYAKEALETQKLKGRISGLRAEISELKQRHATQLQQVETLDAQLPRYRKLRDKGYLAKVKYDEHYTQYLAVKADSQETAQLMASRRNALSEARATLSALPTQTAGRVADLRGQVADIEQRRAQTKGRRTYAIKAPVAGRITALQAAVGQEVDSEKPLLTLLPKNAKLRAHLFVPTRAVGFVDVGQSVELQYQAFPHERFGIYNGEISAVADSILTPQEVPAPLPLDQPVYRVKVTLDAQQVRAYGKALPLEAGMLLDADIILEHRSLIDWLLDPLYSLTGRF